MTDVNTNKGHKRCSKISISHYICLSIPGIAHISKTALKEKLEDKNPAFAYGFCFTFTFHKPTSNADTEFKKWIFISDSFNVISSTSARKSKYKIYTCKSHRFTQVNLIKQTNNQSHCHRSSTSCLVRFQQNSTRSFKENKLYSKRCHWLKRDWFLKGKIAYSSCTPVMQKAGRTWW